MNRVAPLFLALVCAGCGDWPQINPAARRAALTDFGERQRQAELQRQRDLDDIKEGERLRLEQERLEREKERLRARPLVPEPCAHEAFDEATMRAWHARGFRAGWMSRTDTYHFSPNKADVPNPIPAFETWWELTSESFDGLEVPIPFGLSAPYRSPAKQHCGAVLKALGGMKALAVLHLQCHDAADEHLAELGRLGNLESLWLYATPREAGLAALGKLTNLRVLGFSGTHTAAQLRHLAPLTKLEWLACTLDCDDALKALPPMPHLRYLMVGGANFTGTGLRHLAGCKALDTFRSTNSPITDDGLKAICAHPGLSWLELGDHLVTDTGLKELSRLKHLKRLTLGACLITDAGLKNLTGCAALESVDFSRAERVTGAALTALKGVKSLKEFRLDWRFFDDALAELPEFPNLNSLSLESKRFTDVELRHLAALKHLTSLTLNCPNVGEAGLQMVGRIGTLTRLSLSGDLITDKAVEHLVALKNVEYLNIKGTRLTDAGLKRFAGYRELRELELSGAGFTDEGLEVLAGLDKLARLELHEHLELERFKRPAPVTFSGTGLKHLSPAVQRLSISINGATDEGLRALSQHRGVSAVRVYQHTCTGAGLKHIAEMKDLGLFFIDGDVRADDLRALQKALPRCHIGY